MFAPCVKWCKRILWLLVIGFILLNALAFMHSRAMLVYGGNSAERTPRPETLTLLDEIQIVAAGVSVPRPDKSPLPTYFAELGGEVYQIDVNDQITLEGWFIDSGAENPLVILFHGYSAGKDSLVLEAKALVNIGASVLLIDFRGSGGSSESYTTLGVAEALDVSAAVHFAQAQLNAPRIYLFGRSMGAAAILKAVKDDSLTIDGVILESVFDRMLSPVRNRFFLMGVPPIFPGPECLVFWGGLQKGFNGFDHNPEDYALSVKQPVILLHGALDQRATLEGARNVFEALSGPKEFHTFERAGHESLFLKDPEKWTETVRSFLNIDQE